MSKELAYGDQVYIQFNSNELSLLRVNYLICSNGFFDESLIAIESPDNTNNTHTAFINCIFTLLPCLVDTKDENELLENLEEELELLPSESNDFKQQNTHLGYSTLRKNILEKKKSLKKREASLSLINQKIISESIGKSIRFGESVLFQHMISGSFLCASQNLHSKDSNLLNLILVEETRQDCYFRILNLHDNARDSVEYNTDLRIVSDKYNTQIAMGISLFDKSLNNTKGGDFAENSSNDDDQSVKSEKKKSIFPLEITMKEPPIETFLGNKFYTGMQFENENPIPIRFIEYCSRSDIEKYNKSKNMKNGIFVRLQSSYGYLTGGRFDDRSHLTLDIYNNDEYHYNYINTIFQIIDSQERIDDENRHELPKGTEIFSISKKLLSNEGTANYYLRHFSTGYYVSNNYLDPITKQSSCENSENEDNGGGDNPDENIMENIPYIEFVSLLQDQELQTINKSSSLALRVKEKQGRSRFLVDKIHIQQNLDQNTEIVNEFYVGGHETDSIIKPTIKISQKSIGFDLTNGLQFKLLPVPESQMIDIMEIESYIDCLKHYLKFLQNSKNTDQLDTDSLNSNTNLALKASNKILNFFKKHDNSINLLLNQTGQISGSMNTSDLLANHFKQTICREFKMIDVLSMIFYHLLVDQWFAIEFIKLDRNSSFRRASTSFAQDDGRRTSCLLPGKKKESIIYEKLEEMFDSMTKSLILVIKNNNLNQQYCSQFLKIFLHGFFTPSGLLNLANDIIKHKIKQALMNLIIEILDHEGSIYSNQLESFESKLFDLLILHNDEFDQINLIFLNFVFKLKSSVIQNTIVRNFINEYLDDDEKRKLLLPKFKSKDANITLQTKSSHQYMDDYTDDTEEEDEGEEDMEDNIYAIVKKYDNTEEFEINLNEQNPKARYVIGMFEILNSLAKQNSLKFSQIIIRHYPIESCLKILENRKLLPQIKDEISKLLKNVHDSYTQLPIKEIPHQIQLIFQNHSQFSKKAEEVIQKAKVTLISSAEKELLSQRRLYNLRNIDQKALNPIKNNNSAVEIKNLVINLEEDFENQSYKIHLMENVLTDSYILEPNQVLMIHNNIAKLLKKFTEVDDNSSTSETNVFIDNAEIIFCIMELVDDQVIRLALMETFKHIRQKLVHESENNNTNIPAKTDGLPSFTSLLKNAKEPQIAIENMEKDVSKRFLEAFSEDWRNKKNLYKHALVKFDNNEEAFNNRNEVFLEEHIINFIWKLFEKKDAKLAGLSIKALQKKAKFESRVLNEFDKWTIISSEKEGEKMAAIIDSLLKCHQISRRLKIIKEFNIDKIDNKVEEISKVVLESLENIIVSTYDYSQHIGKTIEGEKDQKKLFLSRLRESKKNIILEKPFVYKEKCIKKPFQRIMANLNAHNILISLIPEFFYATNFVSTDPDFILIYRYIAIILIIFVKDNHNNQLLLANNRNLISIFSENEVIEANTDTVSLFFEICHGNKKLLKLELPHINQIMQKYFFKQQNLLEAEDEEEGEELKIRVRPSSRSIALNKNILFGNDFNKNQKPKNPRMAFSRKASKIDDFDSSNTKPSLTNQSASPDKIDNAPESEDASKPLIPFLLTGNIRTNRLQELGPNQETTCKVNPYKNINKIRNLSLIFSSNLPKDSFDIDSVMLDKLHHLDEFLASGDFFSLSSVLSAKPILTIGEVKKSFFSMLKLKPENNAESTEPKSTWFRYELPVKYSLVKELVIAVLSYAETNDKTKIMFMQSKRQSKDFLNYLINKNIEYHFEIKGLILQLMDKLFYKKFKKPNAFETIEDFDRFISHLFVDMIGYILYQSNKSAKDNQPNYELFFVSKHCFLLEFPRVKRGIQNYQKLFKIHSINTLNRATFLEYQHDVYFIDSWKKYIFDDVTNIFSNILNFDSELMLIQKEKSDQKDQDIKFHSYFDVWLFLIKKLIEVEEDKKYTQKLLEVIKKVILIPDFSNYKEPLNSFKAQVQDTTKQAKTENSVAKQYTFLLTNLVSDVFTKLDLRDLLKNHINEGMKNKQKFRKDNIRIFAKSAIESEASIRLLVNFIGQESKEGSSRDIIFVLRLLRNLIEIQNPRESDFNKPIYEWDDLSSDDFEKIVIIQDRLKKFQIVKALYNLFLNFKHNPKIFRETLELSISLLYGGNKDIQDLYYQEFTNDTENSLIQNLARLIDNIFGNMFTSEAIRNRALYFRAQTFIYEYFEVKENISKLGYKDQIAEKFRDNLSIKEKEDIKDNSDYILLMMILKFMQCLCENHHTAFQEFLTNQIFDGRNHSQSFNFTAYFRTMYHKYLRILNKYNIDIGIKLVDLLIEILQGESKEIANIMLRKTLVTDLCQTLTCYDNDLDLLPRGFGFDKYSRKLQDLKSKCIILLKTLLERSNINTGDNSNTNVNKYYDIDCIVSFMVSSFQKYTNNKGSLPDNRNVEIKEYFTEPYLLNGIGCYIILKYLCINEEFNTKMTESLEKLDLSSQERTQMDYMIFNFCKIYVGSIEILQKKTNQIVKIYFPILVVFHYLTLDMRSNFEENVDRSNTQTKAEEFIQAVDGLISQIFLEYNSRNRFLGVNMNNIFKCLRFSTNVIALLANVVNIITLRYINSNDETSENQQSDTEYVQQDFYATEIVTLLGIINTILSLALLIIWGSSKMDKILKSSWVEYYEENLKVLGTLPPMTESYFMNNKEEVIPPKEISDIILKVVEPYSEEWEIAKSQSPMLYYMISFKFLMFCKTFIWHLFYFFISAGSALHPLICGIQLWDIVVRSDTISRLATAISNNARQFLWTIVLLMTTIYMYSLIGLFYLNEEFVEDGVRLCSDEYSCFLVNLNYGLRSGGGIAESLSKPLYDSNNRGLYLLRVIFDLSFFIVVIILMMNLIFGMIIDSFGELRDEKNKNEDDMNNVCFICGISRNEIERYFDFQHHIEQEHNLWYYLAYLIYVQEKNKAAPTELTDIESYVWDRYTKKDHAWLPSGRSLSLEIIFEQGEKQKKSEIDLLKEDIQQVFSTILKENKMMGDEIKELKNLFTKNKAKRKNTTFTTLKRYEKPVNLDSD